MKRIKPKLNLHIFNSVIILLIAVSFILSVFIVRNFAREDCFIRIEETTSQVAQMFVHAMDERQDKLTVFADILAANSENPESLLLTYMENFCRTQYFSAVCIHRPDGRVTAWGDHPHVMDSAGSFEEEVGRQPYVSRIFSEGDRAAQQVLFQAVPIIREGKAIALLYGYTSLDVLPTFLASNAYDGKCRFFVVDGDTGNYLMDEYHGFLGNIYDSSQGRESPEGYDADDMRDGVKHGRDGYYVFRGRQTGEWYYTYYMPLGINNWSMQLTIDEETAFRGYNNINTLLLALMVVVLAMMIVHVALLMVQNGRARQQDKARIKRSDYINAVQGALIQAQGRPDCLTDALELVAKEAEAAAVTLVAFKDGMAMDVQSFPEKAMESVMGVLGDDVRQAFPMLFDMLADQHCRVFDNLDPDTDMPPQYRAIFDRLRIDNVTVAPITDQAGQLRGALSAINRKGGNMTCDVLTCVAYDFFMAMANLQNHNIIKRMGETDYLTGTKNRNSYETALADYAAMKAESLWCVFIDVNGLHEVNNAHGHKAGDAMLCTVADAVKDVFGEAHTYRHGGDEFVSFATNGTHEEFMHKKYKLTGGLADMGYYVSVGFAGVRRGEDGRFDVGRVVAEAEAIMYKDKWQYYQEHDIPSARGHFPELEGGAAFRGDAT